jgi:hypothetical protein
MKMEPNALLDLMPVDIKSYVQRKRRDIKAIALSIIVYQQGLTFEEKLRTIIISW